MPLGAEVFCLTLCPRRPLRVEKSVPRYDPPVRRQWCFASSKLILYCPCDNREENASRERAGECRAMLLCEAIPNVIGSDSVATPDACDLRCDKHWSWNEHETAPTRILGGVRLLRWPELLFPRSACLHIIPRSNDVKKCACSA